MTAYTEHDLLTESEAVARAEALREAGLLNLTRPVTPGGLALGRIGSPGLSRNNLLERHHRDVVCCCSHTPQNDTLLLNTGKEALVRKD